MAHTLEGVEFLDLRLLERAITMGDGHLHTVLQRTTMHATHGDAALITRVVERGNEHLRGSFYLLWSRNHLDDLIQ